MCKLVNLKHSTIVFVLRDHAHGLTWALESIMCAMIMPTCPSVVPSRWWHSKKTYKSTKAQKKPLSHSFMMELFIYYYYSWWIQCMRDDACVWALVADCVRLGRNWNDKLMWWLFQTTFPCKTNPQKALGHNRS